MIIASRLIRRSTSLTIALAAGAAGCGDDNDRAPWVAALGDRDAISELRGLAITGEGGRFESYQGHAPGTPVGFSATRVIASYDVAQRLSRMDWRRDNSDGFV